MQISRVEHDYVTVIMVLAAYANFGAVGLGIWVHRLVLRNSIIVGFAINGLAEEAFEYFSTMQKEGFSPNGDSFTGALTVCCHAGLVEKRFQLYDTMTKKERIRPSIKHYGCLVDLLGHGRRLEDAFRVIRIEIDPNCASNYVLLSNMYDADEKWDSVKKVRKKMKVFGIAKKPGFSVLEINCSIHEFVAGDTFHIYSEKIYEVPDQLVVVAYFPDSTKKS
ncbi:hypothetical protein GIB67_038752 [Kingdonia uniflora]|uniref:Pentatricopeptide repeat-containing protein n=1 Tax=Kingdonia uniflora TaxID=39325 RepID=A0A7J7NST2_9MAGN|nr:hypothetical protein GIB67_038752 [Kingdonia uniflora]